MIICVYNHGTLEFTVTVQNRCVYVQRDPCRFHTRAAVTCQTLSTNTETSLHYAHSHCKIFQPNNIDDMPRYPKTPQKYYLYAYFPLTLFRLHCSFKYWYLFKIACTPGWSCAALDENIILCLQHEPMISHFHLLMRTRSSDSRLPYTGVRKTFYASLNVCCLMEYLLILTKRTMHGCVQLYVYKFL